jgi:hypothetical protein
LTGKKGYVKWNLKIDGERREAMNALIPEVKKINKKQEVKKVGVPIAFGMS